jgi:mRNA interferase MazF
LSIFVAGQIVLVDWRDALPKEPNKRRPAIVVEDSDLFDPDYPNVILVPLSEDQSLAASAFRLTIEPTQQNGCSKRCYALSSYLAATSIRRVTPTQSHILPEQLAAIRRQIVLAIGVE